ncbi:unnamed protein product [Anisakis simplex]|uniref:Uncharacterized protein n=1 Tax=Anisakis simplex TaxID=6269 RepID=A0A0M3J093_ANISI|nr:unnamed protein product [Anisakis simplex]
MHVVESIFRRQFQLGRTSSNRYRDGNSNLDARRRIDIPTAVPTWTYVVESISRRQFQLGCTSSNRYPDGNSNLDARRRVDIPTAAPTSFRQQFFADFPPLAYNEPPSANSANQLDKNVPTAMP